MVRHWCELHAMVVYAKVQKAMHMRSMLKLDAMRCASKAATVVLKCRR